MTLIRKSLLLITLLTLAANAKAQTSTTFTIHVVAPASCAVTLASSPISKSGSNLLAGQAGVVNFNVSACSVALVSTATATWDGVTVSIVAPFAVNVTAAQATVGDHVLILTIPAVQPVLTMNSPLQLPNASVGQPYTADLASLTSLQKNGQPCSTCIFSATNLPTGLVLSANGVISGVVLSTNLPSFNFTVIDTASQLSYVLPTNSFGDFRDGSIAHAESTRQEFIPSAFRSMESTNLFNLANGQSSLRMSNANYHTAFRSHVGIVVSAGA